jgi:hypothetical protein
MLKLIYMQNVNVLIKFLKLIRFEKQYLIFENLFSLLNF